MNNITLRILNILSNMNIRENYINVINTNNSIETMQNMNVKDITSIVKKCVEKDENIEKYIKYDIPWGEIGYVTYKRTYSRTIQNSVIPLSEEYEDTIDRVLSACNNQLNVNLTENELSRSRKYFLDLKCSVAGRFLWQLGTSTVDKLGLSSLQNCAFINIDEPIYPFLWIFDMLMLGCGIGFSVQKKHISKIPQVLNNNISIKQLNTYDATYIVPDSREGWVNLLKEVLTCYFITGSNMTYSTILVRPAGTPIKGFGGVASGPTDLCIGIEEIIKILNNRRGTKLTSVDCLDLVNIIAKIVVSGNVRRSALLCLGDCDDIEYLNAKRWDLGNIPNWRCMSNNSVVCDDIKKLPECFWEGYKGNGEPYGLINIELSKKIGRLKDGEKYPDPDVEGYNPCAEQSLANNETCCLSEIFLPRITSYDELKDIATILYRICKRSLLLECHHKRTNNIVHKNMRMGIGISGVAQCTKLQLSWLSPLYEHLRTYDNNYSAIMNINRSVKLTTIKPSGTLSLLPGVTSGCHPAIYQYFIRRIRISSNNNLINICKSHGYNTEYQQNFDGSLDKTTTIVEFPCKYPENTLLAQNTTAIQQLELIKFLQTEWSDNSVSCTVYYRLEELDDIKKWLNKNFNNNTKTVSFLLHNEHGFKQAPYEEISKDIYESMKSRVSKINNINSYVIDDSNNNECASGACPVK